MSDKRNPRLDPNKTLNEQLADAIARIERLEAAAPGGPPKVADANVPQCFEVCGFEEAMTDGDWVRPAFRLGIRKGDSYAQFFHEADPDITWLRPPTRQNGKE